MSNAAPVVLQAETTEVIRWRRYTFFVLSGILAALGLAAYTLREIYLEGKLEFLEYLIILGITVVLIMVLYHRMYAWCRCKVKYQLEGSTLHVLASYEDNKPVPGNPRTYDLGSLKMVQSLTASLTPETPTAGALKTQRLSLIACENENGPEESLFLSFVPSPGKDEQTHRNESVAWNALCDAIILHFASSVLAERWLRISPFARYKFVLQQAETAFLQARVNSWQMCRASFRPLTDLLWNGQEIFRWATMSIALGFVGTAVMAAMVEVLAARVGLEKWFVQTERGIPTWAIFLIWTTTAFGAGIAVIRCFRPLSTRVENDTMRETLAQQLVNAKATKEDLEPLLKFAKDDLDRAQADLTRYSIVVALTGAMTPFLNQSLETWISAVVLLIVALVFVIIQLYFNAQMQILRLASSSCLIAQSHAIPDSPPSRVPQQVS